VGRKTERLKRRRIENSKRVTQKTGSETKEIRNEEMNINWFHSVKIN